MKKRTDRRYTMSRIMAYLLVAALTLFFSGCSEGQQEEFPSVRATQEKTEPSDQDSHAGRSLSWMDPDGQEIILTVAAPMSQESLNRIRLLFLYKLDIVRSGQPENGETNGADLLYQESLIHQLDYNLDRLDRFLADYDQENFKLEQIPVLLDSGATREQQEIWLSAANHPNIFYSADASLYYQQNRLSDLETLVSQDARFRPGTVYSNVMQPFYQNGGLYGLPFLMTYPIIIGSADVWESESGRSIERWDAWLDQLSLSFEMAERENIDPPLEEPPEEIDQMDRPLPFSLDQPWLTYMQLAYMDQPTIDRRIGDVIESESIRPSQELVGSWHRLLNIGFAVEKNEDLPAENPIVLPESTFDPGLLSYQDNRGTIQSLAETEAIMAWLDDSSQISFWQSQNQNWQAVGVPALHQSSSYDSSSLLTVRGWFVDNQSVDLQVQAFAEALSVFLSIDPDCYLILALESDDPLTGYLPTIKDNRVWQRYLSDRNQTDLTIRQWQDMIPLAIISDDLLREGWSEQLHRSLQDEITAWFKPEDTDNRTE